MDRSRPAGQPQDNVERQPRSSTSRRRSASSGQCRPSNAVLSAPSGCRLVVEKQRNPKKKRKKKQSLFSLHTDHVPAVLPPRRGQPTHLGTCSRMHLTHTHKHAASFLSFSFSLFCGCCSPPHLSPLLPSPNGSSSHPPHIPSYTSNNNSRPGFRCRRCLLSSRRSQHNYGMAPVKSRRRRVVRPPAP